MIVDPTQCTVVGTTRTCNPFAGNVIPASRMNGISKKLLEFYPEPNNGIAGLSNNNYLSLQDREINKYQYTQRMDLVQSSASAWMGRYSYGKENEDCAGVEAERHEAGHAGSSGRARQHLDGVVDARQRIPVRLQLLLQHVRTRAGERARRDQGAEHPRHLAQSCRGMGDSVNQRHRVQRLRRQHRRAVYEPNRAFEFSDNVSWIRGRHSFKVGGGIRYDMYNQVGNQFARGNFQFQPIATGYAFADFLLGYTQQDESAVALAVTKFRALSQAYYFADTWKVRSNMTFDLGLRYEYTPPWFDANGTLMNASIPCHDTTPNVQNLACHPVLVRIGSGDVYEGTVLRFAPNIQVARDGRLGDRLISDDKKNFAPRVGWAWNPSEKWSFRAGTGIFYMQDTGNPRFDMARNLSGRRRDNTLLLTPDLTLDAPFRGGSGTANDCGVAPPLVCLSNVYVLGNMPDRKTPYMFQYLFNVQRELGSSTALEIGYLGSHSYRLERMFDWNETIPGLIGIGAEPEAVS